VEHAVPNEEEVLAGALGDEAVLVEEEGLVEAGGDGVHARERRVHVVAAGLGLARHGEGG
jgi:hypothetical protein